MDGDWFREWAELHCEATAAPPEALAALLHGRDLFVSEWHATPAELGECTTRLKRNLEVPKFANDHHEAVARELFALRREREAATRAAATVRPPETPACRYCGDTGLVTLPHPRCVEVPAYDPPRLVGFPDRTRPFTDSLEISARCMECAVGRFGKAAQITTVNYLRQIGGALKLIAVVALLDEHRRAAAGRAWQLAPKGAVDWTATLENIKRRVRRPESEEDAA